MSFNSRRESEVFGYFYQFNIVLKSYGEKIETKSFISKLEEISNSTENDKLKAQNRLNNLNTKFLKLVDEVESFPVNTLGTVLDKKTYDQVKESNKHSSGSINFHYAIRQSKNVHEVIYTVKSESNKNLIYFLYAPESAFKDTQINPQNVTNHLCYGGLGVKVAHPYPAIIGSGTTEIVTVLLDDLNPTQNYFFQLFVISERGFISSQTMRLHIATALNRQEDTRREPETPGIRKSPIDFIRASYANRTNKNSIMNIHERFGNPSNNSRYDKGG